MKEILKSIVLFIYSLLLMIKNVCALAISLFGFLLAAGATVFFIIFLIKMMLAALY